MAEEKSVATVETPAPSENDAAIAELFGEEQPETSTTSEETPAEGPEGKTGEPEKPVEEPPLILGKFKSQEELAKAYQNLEAYATRLAQERKAAEVSAPASTATAVPMPELTAEEAQAQFWEEMQTDPFGTLRKAYDAIEKSKKAGVEELIRPFQEDLARRQADLMLKEAREKHEKSELGKIISFDTLGPIALSKLEAYPELADRPDALDIAIKLALTDKVPELFASAKTAGKEEAYGKIKQKTGAFAEASTPSKPEEERSEEDKIADEILAVKPRKFGHR